MPPGTMGVTDVVALAFVATAASWTIVSVARLAAKWHRESHSGESSGEVAAFEERLSRVERAVEALTVDSGRLIDGQRILTQLLADRSGAPQPVGRIDRA